MYLQIVFIFSIQFIGTCSCFPPLRKLIDTIMRKVNTVSYDFDKKKIELEIEKNKKDNWYENKSKIKDDCRRQ